MEKLRGDLEVDNGERTRIVISASENVGNTLEIDKMLPFLIPVFSFKH